MLANLIRQPAHGHDLRQCVAQCTCTTLSNNSLTQYQSGWILMAAAGPGLTASGRDR